jgi:hypothetical protein
MYLGIIIMHPGGFYNAFHLAARGVLKVREILMKLALPLQAPKPTRCHRERTLRSILYLDYRGSLHCKECFSR